MTPRNPTRHPDDVRICYSSTRYRSHWRAASAYIDVLGSAYELVPEERYADADVLVLHHEPHQLEAVYRRHPDLLERYVIGYLVWDADRLPESCHQSVARLHEIWTCSRYSHAAFARHHPRVVRIPFIVDRDEASSQEDLAWARAAVRHEEDAVYFLAIARWHDMRKNMRTLVDTFLRLSPRMPRARLIVKAAVHDVDPPYRHPALIWLPEVVSEGRITALYRIAHAYVSAHHAEGWGFTLSDAMWLGTPVIATGYSGNLDFMNDENSFLIRCTEESIRQADCFGPFEPSMRWAYPDVRDLEDKLRFVYEGVDGEIVALKRRRARADIERFSRDHVARQLLARMEAVAAHV